MPASDQAEWFYTDGSGTFGPFHFEVLRQLRGAGVIRSEFMLWKCGLEGWIPATTIDLPVAPSFPDVPLRRAVVSGTTAGQPLHAQAMKPATRDQGVSKSENPLAVAGIAVVFLAVVAFGIWFWSGRPELLAIVLVGALTKRLVFGPSRR